MKNKAKQYEDITSESALSPKDEPFSQTNPKVNTGEEFRLKNILQLLVCEFHMNKEQQKNDQQKTDSSSTRCTSACVWRGGVWRGDFVRTVVFCINIHSLIDKHKTVETRIAKEETEKKQQQKQSRKGWRGGGSGEYSSSKIF